MEIVRYYQAGVINTAFGLGMYAALVWAGLGIYAAQALSHVLGMGFNYVTYSRHVFSESGPAKTRFVLSYAVNYVLGVGVLALVSRGIENPYLSGFVSAVIVSAVNFFFLKLFVFRAAAP